MTGKITLSTAILGSALLLAAPAAWGDPWAADRADRAGSPVRPDDRAGMLGVGAVSTGEPYARAGSVVSRTTAATASRAVTPQTFRFVAVVLPKTETYVDNGKSGESPGDVVVFSERLHRVSSASAPVGRTEVSCLVLGQNRGRCTATLVLARGTIEVAGFLRFIDGTKYRLPLVGGTKAYAGARGELVGTNSGTTSRYVLTLLA